MVLQGVIPAAALVATCVVVGLLARTPWWWLPGTLMTAGGIAVAYGLVPPIPDLGEAFIGLWILLAMLAITRALIVLGALTLMVSFLARRAYLRSLEPAPPAPLPVARVVR